MRKGFVNSWRLRYPKANAPASHIYLGEPAATGSSVGGFSRTDLDSLYNALGYLAALDAPGGRDADFARNQSQGAWAEGLLAAYVGSHQFVKFGTSNPISPTAPGYEAVRRHHRNVELREGKRPDFLLIPKDTIDENPAVLSWNERQLTASETVALPETVTCAVEVKSSLYDFAVRETYRARDLGLSPVSITLKEEEIPGLVAWQSAAGIPIIIVQVFVDSIHACSLEKFRRAIGENRTTRRVEPKTTKATRLLRLPEGGWRIASISTSAGYRFSTTAKGEVTAPHIWPPASLFDVNISGIIDAAPRLKEEIRARRTSSGHQLGSSRCDHGASGGTR